MGTELAVGRHVDAWWRTYVPEVVVTAFDACATTGRGPDRALAHGAYAILVEGLARLRGGEGPGGDEIDANDAVGCPTLGLTLFVRSRYGWAVPDGAALDAIARDHAGETVVEIGCGSGYVAACLRARGLDVTAVAAPEHSCDWAGWWRKAFASNRVRSLASALSYEARTYVMLMPDGRRAGEDMMVEALSRMPTGSTLYLYAPRGCAGSKAGFALLDATFVEVGELPMLDTCPGDPEEEREERSLIRYVKASPRGVGDGASPL